MALTKELLKVLDDDHEPFPKRLKIADNAFKSVELPIQRREAILLKWLGKVTQTDSKDAWNLLLSWLKSQQMQDLNRNDISREDVKNLMNVISTHMKAQNATDVGTIVNCASALIQNRNFQLFFKFDLEDYCKFISAVLYEIKDADLLRSFITNEQLFNRNLTSHEEFHKHFIENNLEFLGLIVEKFNDDKKIFQAVSKLIEKCLFHRNFKSFSAYLQLFLNDDKSEQSIDGELPVLPKLLIKTIKNFYKNDKCPKYVYKLILHAYCSSYSNSFEMVYKFFIVIAETLGFDLSTYFNMCKIKKAKQNSLTKSLPILSELCQVLTENANELGFKLNDKTFSEFLQNLTLTVISITKQPDKTCYDFLTHIITLDPLVVEKILGEVVVYTMLSNKESVKVQYEKFIIALFEVFAKLHRIPNLIAKITRILKAALEDDFKPTPSAFGFCGGHSTSEANFTLVMDMLPNPVLEYFTQCITTLASWQVINLFKTLLFHLEATVSNDLPATNEAETKVVYVQIIGTLMCQFLLSVRIAEHTVTSAVVEKFVKCMNEAKEVLGKFGTALVYVDHNPVLMGTYLNICYAWGELYITLAYYSIKDEVVLQKTLDSDSSACNITYVHPYLTRDQWCLISQRITNFGEKPCKLIMHKLYIQKLRAMMLFEEAIGEDISSSIKTSILSTVEDHWKDIIFDQLVLEQIIAKSSSLSSVSELVLQDMIKTNTFEPLQQFFDHKELIGAMLYTALSKLNKAFKRKQKKKQAAVRLPLISKVFPYVTEDLFLNPKQAGEGVQQLTDVFVKELSLEAQRSEDEIISTINEKDVSDYFDVIRAIPVMQCDYSTIHEILIVCLVCVLFDLKCSSVQDTTLVSKCESIIIGLAQNYSGSFKALIQPFSTTQAIINTFSRYLDIFTFIAQNIFKNEEDVTHFQKGIKFLTKNIKQERYLHCTTVVLNFINKSKKTKSSAQTKTIVVGYQEEIHKSIIEHVQKHKDEDLTELTEAYALTLKHYLSNDADEGVSKLLPYLDKFIEQIVNKCEKSTKHAKGGILLLTTVIHNKSKLKTIQEDFVLKAWNYCQNLSAKDKEHEDYSKLVMLIFGHIPNKQFSTISADLLKFASQALKENPKQFSEQMKIWSAILGCDFNPEKTEMWQKTLESLLLQTILVYLQDSSQKERGGIYEHVVKLEINIMQNLHLLLTPPLLEAILITVSVIISSSSSNFVSKFTLCVSLLETLLKYRKPLTMDYLPTYLQRYRALLNVLCTQSNSDVKLETSEVQQLADCAHKFEKLTNTLVACNRPIARISPYLIADILKHYEEITLYPNVKIHLNNCLYSLVTLCDQHAISYLLRILSTASTEMFKVIHENYRKYYKFTGKV